MAERTSVSDISIGITPVSITPVSIMGLLQKHAVLTAFGLVLSVAAIAWLQPNQGGTTFVVVFLLIVMNALGAIFIRSKPSNDA